MKLSSVRKAWRRAILETGEVRKRINRLEESESEENSRRILASRFKVPVDDITVLCYLKLLEKSGVVYGWGRNSHGQLTDQAAGEQTLPIEITKFGTVTKIAAGREASFVVKETGLFAVGANFSSHLGLGNDQLDDVFVPTKVNLPDDLSPIRSLANQYSSSFAVDTSGRLLSWGNNLYGRLGRETQDLFDGTPRMITSLQNYKIKQVACGWGHVCCLTSNGEVLTWGNKGYVGQGHLDSDVRVPTKLNIDKICQISCGAYHTLLLSDKKTVWAFGANNYGQLGHDPELQIAKTPIKMPFSGEKKIVKIQCCGHDSAILSADGEIRVWGKTRSSRNPGSPRFVIPGQAVDISLGGTFHGGFMLVLTDENRLYAFGNNKRGQCGQGSTTDPFIEQPVEVKNLQNLRIKQISAGCDHCLIKCEKS